MKHLIFLPALGLFLFPAGIANGGVPHSADLPSLPPEEDGDDAAQQQALATAATPYLEWNRELRRLLQDLGEGLGRIHDEASATAAAPQVSHFMQELSRLQKQEKELPPPSDELARYIAQQLPDAGEAEQLAGQSYGRMLELLLDQEPPCHGSQALQEAIRQLLLSLTGYE